jgi:hypothetical protein
MYLFLSLDCDLDRDRCLCLRSQSPPSCSCRLCDHHKHLLTDLRKLLYWQLDQDNKNDHCQRSNLETTKAHDQPLRTLQIARYYYYTWQPSQNDTKKNKKITETKGKKMHLGTCLGHPCLLLSHYLHHGGDSPCNFFHLCLCQIHDHPSAAADLYCNNSHLFLCPCLGFPLHEKDAVEIGHRFLSYPARRRQILLFCHPPQNFFDKKTYYCAEEGATPSSR